MRDIRVTDDIFTGPATDESDEFVDLFVDEEWEHDAPDAIDRFIAERAGAGASLTAPVENNDGGLPSAA